MKRMIFRLLSLLFMSVMIIGCPLAPLPSISISEMKWSSTAISRDENIRFMFKYNILDSPSSTLKLSVFEVEDSSLIQRDVKIYTDKQGSHSGSVLIEATSANGYEKGGKYGIKWEFTSGEHTFSGESSAFSVLTSAFSPIPTFVTQPESLLNGDIITINPTGSKFSANDTIFSGTVDYAAIDSEGVAISFLSKIGVTNFSSWSTLIPQNFVSDPDGFRNITLNMTIDNGTETGVFTKELRVSYKKGIEPNASNLVYHYEDDGSTAYPIDVTDLPSNINNDSGGKLSVLNALKTVGQNGTIIFKLTRKSNTAPSWLGLFSVGTLGHSESYDVYHHQNNANSTGRENKAETGNINFDSGLALNTAKYVAWQVNSGETRSVSSKSTHNGYSSGNLFYDGTDFTTVVVGGIVRDPITNPINRADIVVDEILVYDIPLDDLYLRQLCGTPEPTYLVETTLFKPGGISKLGGRRSYRIPAIITNSKTGAVITTLDARSHDADSPNNIDIAFKVSKDNGRTFSQAEHIPGFYFKDFEDYNAGWRSDSASFIDSVLVEGKDGRIIVGTNMWPAGTGLKGTKTTTGDGYMNKTIVGVQKRVLALGYFPLQDSDQNSGNISNGDQTSVKNGAYNMVDGSTLTDTATVKYNYYIVDSDLWPSEVSINGVPATNETMERRIYDNQGQETEYYLDAFFNVCHDVDGSLTVRQRNGSGSYTGVTVPMNIAFRDSKFQIRGAGYFWAVYTEDDGSTWSAPKFMNSKLNRPATAKYSIISPGSAIMTKDPNSSVKGRIFAGIYVSRLDNIAQETATTIYSDDNGKTWEQTPFPTSTLTQSEAYPIEMPNNGGIRLFGRTRLLGEAVSAEISRAGTILTSNYGLSWDGDAEKLLGVVAPWCQQSGVRLWQAGYGTENPHFIMSYPNSENREFGAISLFRIDNDGSAVGDLVEVGYRRITEGDYGYSSITELADGNFALIYEPITTRNAAGINTLMYYKVFTLDWVLNGRR